jgi:hypothetical protein
MVQSPRDPIYREHGTFGSAMEACYNPLARIEESSRAKQGVEKVLVEIDPRRSPEWQRQ